jgi:hypothetical protein
MKNDKSAGFSGLSLDFKIFVFLKKNQSFKRFKSNRPEPTKPRTDISIMRGSSGDESFARAHPSSDRKVGP